MYKPIAVAFLVSAVVSGIAAYPRAARAFSRYSGTEACQQSALGSLPNLGAADNWRHQSGYGFRWLGTGSAGRAVCPIVDDTSLPKGNIADVTVYVHDGSTSAWVYARACGQNPVGSAIYCGISASSGLPSFTGYDNFTITDVSPWAGIVNLYQAYLYVEAPASGGTSTTDSRVIAYAYGD